MTLMLDNTDFKQDLNQPTFRFPHHVIKGI